MKKLFWLTLAVLLSLGCISVDEPKVNSFDECVKAGYPVMESYPRQCRTPDGANFVEEVSQEERPIGGERDEHGCLGPAGYSWNESLGECMRQWSGELQDGLTVEQAVDIARRGCGGEGTVSLNYFRNFNTDTWWFDYTPNTPNAGCNPACVVDENLKTGEVNWRCTGLKAD